MDSRGNFIKKRCCRDLIGAVVYESNAGVRKRARALHESWVHRGQHCPSMQYSC